MIESFWHRGLRELFETGRSARVRADLQRRVLVRLAAIDSAATREALNQPGFDFHALRGRPRRYSIHVNGPCASPSNGVMDGRYGSISSSTIEEGSRMPAATQPAAKCPEYPVRRPLKRPAVHPGALMREILEDHFKLTIAEAARRMGVSRPALYAVLNGTAAVTAEMALRFARLTGGAPELYLNMQTSYDLDAARQRLSDDLGSPRPDTRRWVKRRKAAVVTAVRSGRITLEEALRRYQLTEAEYRLWEQSFGSRVTASDSRQRSRPQDEASRPAETTAGLPGHSEKRRRGTTS